MSTLSLSEWDAKSSAERLAWSRVLSDQLQEAGKPYVFSTLRTVGTFTPDADRTPATPREVAVFRGPDDGEWVFVPGGTVRPWSTVEQDKLLAALRDIEGWRAESELEPDEEPYAFVLEQICPYGGAGFDVQAMLAVSGDVRPLLVSPRLLAATDARAKAAYQKAEKRIRALDAQPGDEATFAAYADELDGVLAPGSRLMTSAEAAWLMGAGNNCIFPWGDALPKWMIDDDGPDFGELFPLEGERDESDWARANALGIIDANVMSEWVRDGSTLSWLGGAAYCYPWQACGEWAGFISRAIVPYTPGDHGGGAFGLGLRPVVEL